MFVLAAVDVGTEAEADFICEGVGVVFYLLEGDHAVDLGHLGLGWLDGHRDLVLSHGLYLTAVFWLTVITEGDRWLTDKDSC